MGRKLRYCVITDTSDEEGNMHDATLTTDGKKLYAEWSDTLYAEWSDTRRLLLGSDGFPFDVKIPTFEMGEIVIIDAEVGGREVNGPGRKPQKWFIGYEVYDDIEHAVERAIVVSKHYYYSEEGPLPPPTHKPIETQTAEGRKAEVDAVIKRIENLPPEDFNRLPVVRALRKAIDGGEDAPT